MPETLLLVDPQAQRRTRTRAAIEAAGPWTVKEAACPDIARLLAQTGIDGVLCEGWTKPAGPVASCRWAQALTPAALPVLVLVEATAQLDREALFTAGAHDLVMMPVSPAELQRRLTMHLRAVRAEQEIAALKEQQRHLSLHDPLTGLINRDHFLLACRRELAAVARHGLPLTACMIDLDDDGALHHRIGLSAVDALVMTVGQRLESQLRGGDTLSRLGGARFCALLPQTAMTVAHTVAERLRTSVVDIACATAGRITVSLGLAEARPGAGMTVDALLAAAEAHLKAARAAGGNRLRA